MRMIIFLAAMLPHLLAPDTAQAAGNVAVESEIYLELADSPGRAAIRRIEPAASLDRGDRVVTILSWEAPPPGRHLATSRVPAGLTLQSTSRMDVQISTDGGRNWRVLENARQFPAGVTHIRWPLGQRQGSLTYRAIVR